MTLRRVVFDTSSLVSAALRVGSVPHQALLLAFASCELCASTATLIELREVLSREKFQAYLGAEARRSFLQIIESSVLHFDVPEEELVRLNPGCRDAKDDKFLALATVAEAGLLVSSDEDLLVLDPWHGIRVVRPAEFLTMS